MECPTTPNTRRILGSLFWRVQQEPALKRGHPNTTDEDGQMDKSWIVGVRLEA
ncbi:MAG: hypothetical protein IT210_13085 [Armatimonadetes bacterium]|nr:hypothetical protein [Armatimonadota bacterium]